MENKQNFATYEYMTKTVESSEQTSTIDMYEAFGWEATDTTSAFYGVTISFRRDRKIPHKTELNRLARKAEDLKDNIANLHASKTKKASVIAYILGIGSGLVLGGGICMSMLLTANIGALIAGIALSVVGFGLCGLNYLLYKKNVAKKTKEVIPIIEDNEDKIATICEQAHGLLTKQAL